MTAAARVADGVFDTWQAGYANASVEVVVAGTLNTLASIFLDEGLTESAANPQVLLQTVVNGVAYGKFAQPLYCGQPHFLVINSTDQTGVFRPPLATLAQQDASDTDVLAAGGVLARELDTILADDIVASNYGTFSTASATNTATIAAAIGAASARGGGTVWLPEGDIPFTSLSVPGDVLLRGRGRDVTVLQSQIGGNAITLAGDAAGLADLTLDGINQVTASVGIYSVGRNESRLENVAVKRFETGIQQRGARRNAWRALFIDTCLNGVLFRGDLDIGVASAGGEIAGNAWEGGRVINCTGNAVEFRFVDQKLHGNVLANIGFESNTSVALLINGARYTDLDGCWFIGNTTNIAVNDGTDTTKSNLNTVIGFTMAGGYIDSGDSTFTGRCQDMVFDGVELYATQGGMTQVTNSFTLSICGNNILTRDCTEDANVILAGSDALRWVRVRSILGDAPEAFVVTTDATVTAAFRQTLKDGSIVSLEAVVMAIARNGIDKARYHIAQAAFLPGATLLYQAQTANFVVGDLLTGATSGAVGRIIADADGGATGTLTLKDITKEFLSGEAISGSSAGAAVTNGTLTHGAAVLLGSQTAIEAATESDASWDANVAVSGGEARINVTGAAGKTIEWSCSVKVVSS